MVSPIRCRATTCHDWSRRPLNVYIRVYSDTRKQVWFEKCRSHCRCNHISRVLITTSHCQPPLLNHIHWLQSIHQKGSYHQNVDQLLGTLFHAKFWLLEVGECQQIDRRIQCRDPCGSSILFHFHPDGRTVGCILLALFRVQSQEHVHSGHVDHSVLHILHNHVFSGSVACN